MHVRHGSVRTTIELTDQQRAKLLELAARRREKGFSALVQEAVDRYLAEEESRSGRIDAALALAGCLDPEEADALEESVRTIRRTWR
jgi:predicted transcriptional regulator